MKYYKDDCHHYKVISKSRVVTIGLLGGIETSISYENYNHMEHHVITFIRAKTVKECTKTDFDTAFDKALNTIKNLK